jgi:hypothetical protein
VWRCNECESTEGHAVKVVCLCEKQISLHTNHSSKSIYFFVNPLPASSPYARTWCGVYLMKRSELGLADWCLGTLRESIKIYALS